MSFIIDDLYFEDYYDYLYYDYEKSQEINIDYYENEICYNESPDIYEEDYMDYLISNEPNPLNLI